jgi:hypothetical protein
MLNGAERLTLVGVLERALCVGAALSGGAMPKCVASYARSIRFMAESRRREPVHNSRNPESRPPDFILGETPLARS